MKSRLRIANRKSRRFPTAGQPDREGSVIVVVLALLIGMLFLGLLLFKEAAQEDVSSEYFADAGKITEPNLDPEQLFDAALRQIVLGANGNERHSPFYGGRNSLLPTMYGSTMVPFNGEGVRVLGDPTTGNYFVDRDFDGTADGVPYMLQLNQSVAAQSTGTTATDRTVGLGAGTLATFPQPNVPYTYADHTSPFLSYDGWARGGGGPVRVMLPSYHRPQLLRGLAAPANWFTDPATKQRVMRPHKEHFCILSNGQVALDAGGNPIRRFVSDIHAGTIASFPFPVDEDANSNGVLDAGEDLNGNGVLDRPRQGVWSGHGSNYELDVDLDGDGIKESIYLDMDLGVYSTPDGTRRFVPIVSAKVVPLDSRFNINGQGNVARVVRTDGSTALNSTNFNNTDLIHMSSQGVHRSETNPQYGMILGPQPAPAGPELQPHRFYFGADPTGRVHLANMEYWWLKTGRPIYQGTGTISGVVAGVWGESQNMRNAIGTPPNPANLANPLARFPRPGTSGVDDNANQFIGDTYAGEGTIFPNTVVFPRFGHPLAYRGRGDFWQNVTRRRMQAVQRHVFPLYPNYYSNAVQWPFTSGSTLVRLLDEPSETLLEPGLAALQQGDQIFAPDQTILLHASDPDLVTAGLNAGRIHQLAPWTFTNSPVAQTLRRLYTTESWDLKTYSKVHYSGAAAGFRSWEISGANNTFANVAALRPDVQSLLRFDNVPGITSLMRRLSVNGLVERIAVGGGRYRLRTRPLTPHPTTLTRDPISGSATVSVLPGRFSITRPDDPANPINTSAKQEWLARYDRQRMCRDIYTLLYLYGGGNDVDYRGDNSSFAIYTTNELREMAQFAVNLVDALDPDDVITIFEYDTNLGNGWGLDDDAHYDRDSTGALEQERGVVYGVESQKLAFSEALPIFAKKTEMLGVGINHMATDYDDQNHHVFTYFELQNVSPNTVAFDNSAYQVVIKDARNPATIAPTDPSVVERRLIITGNTPPVSAPLTGSDLASRFTVGTQDDTSYIGGTGAIKPSYWLVNPKFGDADDPMAFTQLAPATGGLSLDLMTAALNRYRVVTAQPSGNYGDGTAVTHAAGNPSGRELLTLTNKDSIDGTTTVPVRLVLRRRLNPHRQEPTTFDANAIDHINQSTDNPWVEIDHIDVTLRVFHLPDPMTNTTALRTALENVRSRERYQPLADNLRTHDLNGTVASTPPTPAQQTLYRFNTIGTLNQATSASLPSGFTLWQPHFDRDFASPSELLNIPMYAPDQLTSANGLGTGSVGANKIALAHTATWKFLRPDLPVGPAIPPGQVQVGNRWFRLLELLEVPDRNPLSQAWYIDDIGVDFSVGLQPRTAAKMNLNTMSYPAHLAGLLDAPDVLNLSVNEPPTQPFLSDLTPGEGLRTDWWHEFLRARDGVDPLTGLTLPGVPGIPGTSAAFTYSKPFRDLGYHLDGTNSLEHTVLRSTPSDNNFLGGRRLFELGTQAQHNNYASDTSIDVTTRYRLLSKVMNNSTNRGNLFVIILQIDFFEAEEVTPSNPSVAGERVVRIGAKLPGNQSPGYKAYYVVDRAAAANLVQTADLPVNGNAGPGRFMWSFRQNMDFSSLILSRQRIR